MNNSEATSAFDERLEKLETRLLRVERRLHLDAATSAVVLEALPKTPPPSPPVFEPSTFAPPTPKPVAPPVVATPVMAPSAPATPSDWVESAPVAAPPQTSPVATAPLVAPSDSSADARATDKSLLDWEQLVGGKWALWAGLLSVFGAIASFLAYTWRFLPPPPPEAKVAMGFFAGVAFLVAGEWARKRAQRWFCEGLSGAGLAICFLSLWAGGAYFSIFGFGPTFGGMALVAALGVWLAVRYDALSLNILSVLGGFLTPVLLCGDGGGAGDTAVLLLSYIAILNAGVLGVSLFKRWRASAWLSFGATVMLLLFWSQGADIAAMRGQVWAFFSLYFLLYIATACFYTLARREQTAPEEIGLLLVATALYAPCAHELLRPLMGHFPGAFMLGFALFWAALCILSARLAPGNKLLRDVTGALGLLAFTVAIPIQVAQPWLGIALVGETAVLAWLGRRNGSELLRRAGQIVWVLALLPLFAGMLSPASAPEFGLHAGAWPWLFGLFVTAWLAWTARGRNESDEWPDIYAATTVAGGAWLVAREVGAWNFATESIVMALGIYAVAIFAFGAKTRFEVVRQCALALALSVAAIFAWLSLSQPVPSVRPLFNAPFVALIATAGALYGLTWQTRRGDQIARRAGQIAWGLASLPLFGALLLPAANAQLGLHRGAWPALFAIAFTAALAWNAHKQTEETDELRDAYAAIVVTGGAWLLAREVAAWDYAVNAVLMILAVYAVAVFAVGALSRFAAVRGCASGLAASVAATALTVAWQQGAPELTPFWNARFAAMSVTLGALGAIYQLAKAVDFPLHDLEKAAARAFPLGAVSLVLAAFSTELYFGFAHFAAPQWPNRAFFALAIAWSLAALGALKLGLQTRDINWRVWAYGVGSLALSSLPVNALSNAAVWLPFFNWRFGAFAVAVTVAGVAAWMLNRAKRGGVISAGEGDFIGAAASFAVVLALFSLTQETWEVGRYLAPRGGEWQRGAQMAISLVWSLFGALLLAGGVQFRVQGARLAALGLLAFTVCKVFLFDLSFLDGAGRALSLGGLGVALIFISWLYGRFGRAEAGVS